MGKYSFETNTEVDPNDAQLQGGGEAPRKELKNWSKNGAIVKVCFTQSLCEYSLLMKIAEKQICKNHEITMKSKAVK